MYLIYVPYLVGRSSLVRSRRACVRGCERESVYVRLRLTVVLPNAYAYAPCQYRSGVVLIAFPENCENRDHVDGVGWQDEGEGRREQGRGGAVGSRKAATAILEVQVGADAEAEVEAT